MKLLSLAAAALLFVTSAFSFTSELMQTNSNEKIAEILQTADKNTLVVFDCDGVIFQENDSVWREGGFELMENEIDRVKAFNPTLARGLEITARANMEFELLNPQLPSLVSELQGKGIKTLVLTAISGKSIVNARIKDLAKLGLNFSKSWGALKAACFQLPNDDRTLRYKAGVLASGAFPKGDALTAFLSYSRDYFQYEPESIIFIDDNLINIVSIIERFEDVINLTCVRYTGAQHTPFRYSSSLLKLQFKINYFLRNDIWLSHEEADKEMFKRLSPEAGIPTSINAPKGNALTTFPHHYSNL